VSHKPFIKALIGEGRHIGGLFRITNVSAAIRWGTEGAHGGAGSRSERREGPIADSEALQHAAVTSYDRN
jgi:hypothetical protein